MDEELSKLDKEIVDNEVYDQLGQKWYTAKDDPVALLRQQSKHSNPWVLAEIRKYIGYHAKVLDLGCGAGFFANEAAKAGYTVVGMDISSSALKVAELHDDTKSVSYVYGDAYSIPFERESFDVVVALDLLEHVSDPQKILFEASRVLRPGGLVFFHTFNRNIFSYLFVIQGMRLFIKNTPRYLHVYSLFRKPKEVEELLNNAGLDLRVLRGVGPVIMQRPFWRMLLHREVPQDFRFKWTRYPVISYSGFAKKLRFQ